MLGSSNTPSGNTSLWHLPKMSSVRLQSKNFARWTLITLKRSSEKHLSLSIVTWKRERFVYKNLITTITMLILLSQRCFCCFNSCRSLLSFFPRSWFKFIICFKVKALQSESFLAACCYLCNLFFLEIG